MTTQYESLDDFSTSKYLARRDTTEDGIDATISHVEAVELEDGTVKAVLHFDSEDGFKPMLLNKTNRKRLAKLAGTDSLRELTGQVVNVYDDPEVEYKGEIVGGLRLRKAQAKKK